MNCGLGRSFFYDYIVELVIIVISEVCYVMRFLVEVGLIGNISGGIVE